MSKSAVGTICSGPLRIFRAVVITLMSVILAGFMLISLCYCIPTSAMAESAARSTEVLSQEGLYPSPIPGFSLQLDNWTDSLMINQASYSYEHITDSPVIAAMENYRYFDEEANGSFELDNLAAYWSSSEHNDGSYASYSRYWHGYLVVLKPLLALGMDLSSIRILNAVTQIILIAATISLLMLRHLKRFIIPYIIVLVAIFWPLVPLSMQYSNCFYVMSIGCIGILLAPGYLNRSIFPYAFFAAIGAITSYFDLLTYPLITLGIPLLTFIFRLFSEEAYASIADISKHVVILSFCWIIGYGGMWIAKWVLASIILGKDIVADAARSASIRTGQADHSATILGALGKNFGSLEKTGVGIPFLAVLVCSGLYAFASGMPKKKSCSALIPFLIISLMPVIWIAVLSNHSYIHNWMTYRILAITLGAILAGVLCVGIRNRDLGSKPSSTL